MIPAMHHLKINFMPATHKNLVRALLCLSLAGAPVALAHAQSATTDARGEPINPAKPPPAGRADSSATALPSPSDWERVSIADQKAVSSAQATQPATPPASAPNATTPAAPAKSPATDAPKLVGSYAKVDFD